MSDVLRFEINQPVIIALQSTLFLPVMSKFKRPQHLYVTTENLRLYADGELSRKIQELGMMPGETFGVRKWKKGRNVRFDVWLSPDTEKARAQAEAPLVEAELRKPPSSSVIAMPNPQPERILAPTGTEGPAPMPAPRSVSIPQRRAEVIPFNVAFKEVVEFIDNGLKSTGRQWNDQAVQDMASTVLIAGANKGWVGPWERGEE